LTQFHHLDSPWLAWCDGNPDLYTRAYEFGALAVFSGDTPAQVILQIVQRSFERSLNSRNRAMSVTVQRRYERGDVILLENDAVLEVQQGILAQTMVHEDGSEVLLGLCGPHQLLVPHPADTCYIQLVSHVNSVVTIKPWDLAMQDPGFPEKLRARLQQMEAWAAMQARPHLDQRVFGILSLLAEQFGEVTPQGLLVDVRITHTQLASAVGATRATITRTIGDLRRQSMVSIVMTSDGERFCLLKWEQGHHGFHLDDNDWR
jgi:CRP-like cAMP-binding protein